MDRGVLYLNFGQAMFVPLCVSLFTLRQHYQGPVAIAAETKHCLAGIENDSRLQPLQVVPHFLLDVTSNQQSSQFAKYTAKLHTKTLSPFQDTVFIDSDTLIVGKIDELFPQTASEVVFTVRNNSYSTGAAMRLRIHKYWSKKQPALANRMYSDRTYKNPPINTGIFSLSKDSQDFVRVWQAIGIANPMHSIDEMVAQMIYPDYQHRLLDYRFNGNLKNDCGRPDVRIWHATRNNFWKPTAPHRDVWLAVYDQAIASNIGGIRDFYREFNHRHRIT